MIILYLSMHDACVSALCAIDTRINCFDVMCQSPALIAPALAAGVAAGVVVDTTLSVHHKCIDTKVL